MSVQFDVQSVQPDLKTVQFDEKSDQVDLKSVQFDVEVAYQHKEEHQIFECSLLTSSNERKSNNTSGKCSYGSSERTK